MPTPKEEKELDLNADVWAVRNVFSVGVVFLSVGSAFLMSRVFDVGLFMKVVVIGAKI